MNNPSSPPSIIFNMKIIKIKLSLLLFCYYLKFYQTINFIYQGLSELKIALFILRNCNISFKQFHLFQGYISATFPNYAGICLHTFKCIEIWTRPLYLPIVMFCTLVIGVNFVVDKILSLACIFVMLLLNPLSSETVGKVYFCWFKIDNLSVSNWKWFSFYTVFLLIIT